jgi:hypothetical protein
MVALAAAALAAAPEPKDLEAIRDQLIALDIEKALAAVNALLDRTDLTDAVRVAALDLRAQAHAASDDLDGVEKDYKAILALDAGFSPNRDVLSKKAIERFDRLRRASVGVIHLELDPRDAAVAVDDRPVAIAPDGSFAALAGERRLRLTRKGFDPIETTAHAVAGSDTIVKVRMVPNARALVVRTDVDGVAVALDGTAAGETARTPGSDAASLTLEDVPLGEHELKLAKSCYGTETLPQVVSVDVADRSPKVLPVVAMRPARTRVTAIGAGYEGEVHVDGERAAVLPLKTFEICPGRRTVEVVASGRVVWSGQITTDEPDLTLDLTPRPSAFVFGAGWPSAWGSAPAWSVRGQAVLPAGADLTTPEAWSRLPVPPATDVVVAVTAGAAGVAASERVLLYSPILRRIEDAPAPPGPPPAWTEATIGAAFVGAKPAGIVIASVDVGGPAARAGLASGDRVTAIAGVPVATAAALHAAIASQPPGSKLAIEAASPGGAARRIDCDVVEETRFTPAVAPGAAPAVVAAWAAVDAAAGGPHAPRALANLALLLEQAGDGAAAIDAWRRVRATSSGALAARAAYGIGAGLDAAGRRDEAIEALRQAHTEAARVGDVALAAAAADRLADLGQTAR